MKSHAINKKTHFIGGLYINKNVCTDLIKYFENSPNKTPGAFSTGLDGKLGVDKKAKSSTDVHITLNNQDKEILNYYKEQTKVVEEYNKDLLDDTRINITEEVLIKDLEDYYISLDKCLDEYK